MDKGGTWTVVVQHGTVDYELPSEQDVTLWVNAVGPFSATDIGIRRAAALTVRFVDEAEGRALNATFAGKNKATNVLSFAADVPGFTGVDLLGDIVICAPVVEREALEQEKSCMSHYAHLVVHGTLHLLGFDHQDDVEAKQMERMECDILGALGFPDPYVR